MRKAQSSIEFIGMLGFAFFFFIAMLAAVQYNIFNSNDAKKDLLVKDTASSVREEISIASASTDGYSRNFTIPATILGLEYEASIVDDFIYIKTTDSRHSLALPIENVTGEIIVGSNLIRKTSGRVYLNS